MTGAKKAVFMWKVTSNMLEGRHQLYKKPILLFAEIPKIEILGFAMKKIIIPRLKPFHNILRHTI